MAIVLLKCSNKKCVFHIDQSEQDEICWVQNKNRTNCSIKSACHQLEGNLKQALFFINFREKKDFFVLFSKSFILK